MPHYTRSFVGAGLIVAVLALAACSPASDTPSGNASTATVQPGQLVGTWTLEASFDSPEQPYVAFVQDSTWSASDGCNRVQGTWEVTSTGALTTTSGPQTRMACEGAQLPLAVTLADSVRVDGDTLVITGSDGANTTTLVRTTDSTVGPQGLPIGYWVARTTSTSPFLSISADRSFTGSDGCNTISGTWESTEAETITLTMGASTLMACDGVDQWLNQAATGRVRAGVMTMEAADGTVLGQLNSMGR
ncbi:heat shock protein HslJ [Compostimonas suwonensis]|uniref:Heat shock protein HslJ n=1 Tax=Compostimonas suwonensis TaxID=1048394 RepID=A0A2M9BZU4_9MICO|nr:heat shock protein HslJ [Compostimonas suwonensis]